MEIVSVFNTGSFTVRSSSVWMRMCTAFADWKIVLIVATTSLCLRTTEPLTSRNDSPVLVLLLMLLTYASLLFLIRNEKEARVTFQVLAVIAFSMSIFFFTAAGSGIWCATNTSKNKLVIHESQQPFLYNPFTDKVTLYRKEFEVVGSCLARTQDGVMVKAWTSTVYAIPRDSLPVVFKRYRSQQEVEITANAVLCARVEPIVNHSAFAELSSFRALEYYAPQERQFGFVLNGSIAIKGFEKISPMNGT